MNALLTITAAAAGLAVAGTASAQLIAYEGYDVPPYGDDAGLNGQNPAASATSFGWDGAWSVGSANLQSDAGSLNNAATAYDDLTTGKGRYLASGFTAFRRGNRNIASYTASDTYYMSMFVNGGGSFNSDDRGYAVAGFTNFMTEGAFENTSADNGFGLFAGFRGEDAGADADQADLILRARGASGDLEDTVLLSNVDSNTYHVLYKLEVNVGGGSADQVTYWGNPSDLTDEASMSATAAATGSVSTFSMDTNSRIDRFTVISNEWNRSFFWDETRFGYDLDCVTGSPTPAAAGLLGRGGLLAARRRRA